MKWLKKDGMFLPCCVVSGTAETWRSCCDEFSEFLKERFNINFVTRAIRDGQTILMQLSINGEIYFRLDERFVNSHLIAYDFVSKSLFTVSNYYNNINEYTLYDIDPIVAQSEKIIDFICNSIFGLKGAFAISNATVRLKGNSDIFLEVLRNSNKISQIDSFSYNEEYLIFSSYCNVSILIILRDMSCCSAIKIDYVKLLDDAGKTKCILKTSEDDE